MRNLLVLVLLGGSAVAWAESSGVSGEIEQSTTTTPAEKSAYATKVMEEIRTNVEQVKKLLENARKEGKKDEVDCIQKKLTPLLAIQDVAQTASNAMTGYLAANDSVHSEAEFRKLAVAVKKSRDFYQEALECSGKIETEGKTKGELESDGDDLIDADEVDVPIDVRTDFSPS